MGCLPEGPRLPKVKEQHRTGEEGEGDQGPDQSCICACGCVWALLPQSLIHQEKLLSMTHSGFPDWNSIIPTLKFQPGRP